MRGKNVFQKGFRKIEEIIPRQASRLEGKVKNRGIKNVKKKGGFGKSRTNF